MELSLFARTFPALALKREITKAKLQRYYDGAKASGSRRPVGADVSPQLLTQNGGERLRQYARNLDENHDLAIGVLDSLVNNVIGTGLPIRPLIKDRTGALHTDANLTMAKILEVWSRTATADGTTPFGHAQRLLARSWLRDGETFVHRLKGAMGGYKHPGMIPYSLELLEADYVPYNLTQDKPTPIVQGVELSRWYRPLAYYVAKSHPGDMWAPESGAAAGFFGPGEFTRLDAGNVSHLKLARRINQVRGVSLLHGVIRRLEDIKDYEESEREAARVAASFTGFIERSPDAYTQRGEEEEGDRTLEMSPGMIFDNLLPGESVGTISSDRPSSLVNDFISGQMRRVAAGTGTNYSTISRDYEGSYSSQRQSMVEARPAYDTLRQYFVEVLIRPVYTELVQMAQLSGALILPRSVDPDTIYDVAIAGVTMAYVDPKKEVEADILKIQAGLASRSQVISDRGGDPLVVAKQRDNDVALFGPIDLSHSQTQPDKPEEDATDESD